MSPVTFISRFLPAIVKLFTSFFPLCCINIPCIFVENRGPQPGDDVRNEATLLTWGIVKAADKLPVHTSTSKLGSMPATAHYIGWFKELENIIHSFS